MMISLSTVKGSDGFHSKCDVHQLKKKRDSYSQKMIDSATAQIILKNFPKARVNQR